MQFNLVPHPSTPPSHPDLKVWATVEHARRSAAVATTNIWFGVGAPADRFVIPEPASPAAPTTFGRRPASKLSSGPSARRRYREWNFAPSGEWAAYDFTSTATA